MNIDQIISGLLDLLRKNNYSNATIKFYQLEWNRIKDFLLENYDTLEFTMDKGLDYLEKRHHITSCYDSKSLTEHQVQLIRVVQLLEDYQLHGVLTRRFYASKNKIKLNDAYSQLNMAFKDLLIKEKSNCTVMHYSRESEIFLDYLTQRNILDISTLTLDVCNDYIRTFSGFSFKTVEQKICGLRYFLRYLYDHHFIDKSIASNIHMPMISKTTKIPSVWTIDELKSLFKCINRESPIGKRDYAMILLACVLGLRVGDIKHLQFENIDWAKKTINIVQSKTGKPLTLPLPNEVGWAIIDYIKNGRPTYYETKTIFIKHLPPFDDLSDSNHLYRIIIHYMNQAGLAISKNRHRGFHSLRHTAASLYLEQGTELPIITEILGHSDVDITSVYLKTDIEKLKECVLPLTFDDYEINIQ